MDARDEHTKDPRSELLSAFQDLTRLSHRSVLKDSHEPPQITSALLERLQQLLHAMLGAIVLTELPSGKHQGVLPSSWSGKGYRPLALHGIEEKDVQALLPFVPPEMVWTALPTPDAAWLIWRLPLVLPFSTLQREGIERQEPEQPDVPLYAPHAFLLFGWERQTMQHALTGEQGRLLFSPLADAVGTVLARPLTHEYIRELEIRTDRKALREMELLKAELLASVSHELRSPLTSIKGYATTLLRHERRISREERHEFLLAINTASDRLAGVIDSLLEMSELETGRIEVKPAPVDLPSLVQKAVAVVKDRLGETGGATSFVGTPFVHKQAPFEVLFETPQDETTDQKLIIQADQNRLREVLDHLLDNAIKHMSEGGTIRIFVRLVCSPEDVRGLAEVSWDGGTRLARAQQRYQSMAVIGIQDSGKGIP
ncbi:MAG: hypothetical protein H0U76_03605, partial [Ktedonobacteraceae bacterium]|nr:hypothetical protein [Ktedonobacteraceae bacterium]